MTERDNGASGWHASHSMVVAVALFAAILCAACGDDSSAAPDARSADAPGPDQGVEPGTAYERDELLRIEIEMLPARWDALRMQTRDIDELLGGDCLAAPFGSFGNSTAPRIDRDTRRRPMHWSRW